MDRCFETLSRRSNCQFYQVLPTVKFPWESHQKTWLEAYKITRQEQDQMAVLPPKAAKAQQSGLFKDEIVPVGSVEADDRIRADTSMHPSGSENFFQGKQHNNSRKFVSSQRRSCRCFINETIPGSRTPNCPFWVNLSVSSVNGVPPRVMGIGPAVAIPAV